MNRRKNKFSKIVVGAIVLLNICFTAAVLYIFFKVGSEPTTLIGAWFTFTTGELWMLSNIKKAKIKGGKDNDKLETEIDK